MKHSVESAFLKQQAKEHIIWWWQISQWDLSVQRSLWYQKDKNASDADADLSSLWLSCHSDDINESDIWQWDSKHSEVHQAWLKHQAVWVNSDILSVDEDS